MELGSDKKIWLQPKHYLAFWFDVLLGKNNILTP